MYSEREVNRIQNLCQPQDYKTYDQLISSVRIWTTNHMRSRLVLRRPPARPHSTLHLARAHASLRRGRSYQAALRSEYFGSWTIPEQFKMAEKKQPKMPIPALPVVARPATQPKKRKTEAEKAATKKALDKARGQTRVNIGTAFQRWRQLKEARASKVMPWSLIFCLKGRFWDF